MITIWKRREKLRHDHIQLIIDSLIFINKTAAIFKCIFLNENVWISIKISLKVVLKVSINKIPALVQIMAWRRPGDKLLSEPMMVSLLTHICITQPQWVKSLGLDWMLSNKKHNFQFYVWTQLLYIYNESHAWHQRFFAIRQHWFRKWIGAIKRQAITCTNNKLWLWHN